MIKIGNSYINVSMITRIVDRTVYFSDGKTEVYTEPELQDILAALFNKPRKKESEIMKMVRETKADLAKPVKKAKK